MKTTRGLVASVRAGLAIEDPDYHLLQHNCQVDANLLAAGVAASPQIVRVVGTVVEPILHVVIDGALDPVLHIAVSGVASSAVAGTVCTVVYGLLTTLEPSPTCLPPQLEMR